MTDVSTTCAVVQLVLLETKLLLIYKQLIGIIFEMILMLTSHFFKFPIKLRITNEYAPSKTKRLAKPWLPKRLQASGKKL